jgi:histidine triad (HIT) family protein
MVITEEESSKIKEHLLTQLDNFPEERRDQIKGQINSMTPEQVETFVEKNNLTHLGGQCIFCSIIADKTKSYKIDKDKDNIAILELNPLSKGHSLIVPKEHLEKIPDSANKLTQEVAKRLQDKFKPEKIKLNEINIMGHAILEIIPIYGNEKERHQATEEELSELQEKIKELKKVEINPSPKKDEKESIEKKDDIPILPPRIP